MAKSKNQPEPSVPMTAVKRHCEVQFNLEAINEALTKSAIAKLQTDFTANRYNVEVKYDIHSYEGGDETGLDGASVIFTEKES